MIHLFSLCIKIQTSSKECLFTSHVIINKTKMVVQQIKPTTRDVASLQAIKIGLNTNWSSPPGWGLGGGSITRSWKKKHVTETETRITTAPYREAGVQDANTRLEQRAKQRMTHKPPMKLLSPKACVKIGQWNVRTLFKTGKCAQVIKEMQWSSCGRLREPTGEAKERETPAHLATYKSGRVGEETSHVK